MKKEYASKLLGITVEDVNKICLDKVSSNISLKLFKFLVDIHGGDNPDELYEKAFQLYEKGEYAVAMVYFMKAGKNGNAKALYFIGSMYDNGKGVPQEHTKAFEYYMKAMEFNRINLSLLCKFLI